MLGVGGTVYYGDAIENSNGSIPLPGGGVEGGVDGSFQGEVTAGEFQKVHSVLVDGGDRFGVSAVTVDLHEELTWMGNQGGHVTSYYGPNMDKYTSFQVINNQEIRQILTFDEIILILSQSQLRGQIRRGLPVLTHVSKNLIDMQCMLHTSPTSVLLGGHQETLVEFDLSQSVERGTIGIGESGCAILRGQGHNRIYAGKPTGEIHLLDSRTYRKEQCIEAHSGSLSDFDVHGNELVTCGFSSRHGTLCVDRFLKVYDLRVLRALAPIQVSMDPFMLRFLPSFSSRIACVSPGGQMEILDTQALSSSNIMIYQVSSNGAMCTSFDVSSSCHHMVFGDSSGTLNLFSSSTSCANGNTMFNTYSRDTEFPDPVESLPPISITDEMASLATIPLQLLTPTQQYCSDWPPQYAVPAYRNHPEINPQILQSMKMVGTIGYAPNPGNFRRNQVQYKFDSSGNITTNPPGVMPGGIKPASLSPGGGSTNSANTSPMRSVRHLTPHGGGGGMSPTALPYRHHHHQSSPVHHSPGVPPPRHFTPGKHSHHHHQTQLHQVPGSPPRFYNPGRFSIPKRYAKIEWKKSSFEESDMEPFNKTKFSGLEAITVNSYCNSMLQILYHIEYLRGFLLSHLCKKDACLSCELGFLFHMLDQSRCIPCSGSNFLRAFRVVPEASALGLILQESQAKQRSALFRLIQSWNRFILHQIETETSKAEGDKILEDAVSKLFAMKQENMNRCTRCNREARKESTVFLSNLLYSLDATGNGARCKFTEILQRSLYPEQTTPAWCEDCDKYQPTFQSRVPKVLPTILSLNTCLDNAHDFSTWRKHLESLLPEKPKGMMDPHFSPESSTCLQQQYGQNPLYQQTPHTTLSTMKSCRYGKNCVRPDCKFWHEGRQTAAAHQQAPYDPRMMNQKLTEFEANSEVQVKWLPSKIRISIIDGKVEVTDLDATPLPPLIPEYDGGCTVADYELMSLAVFVKDGDNEDRNNLVALVKVPHSYYDRVCQLPTKTGWLLFNDFSIKEIAASESTSFNPRWKIPSVIYYQRCPMPQELIKYEISPTVTIEVFKETKSTSLSGGKNKKPNYKPLSPEEIPKKGDLVAMDAEFVTLGQEETELRSDGKLATVKPQQLSLARVTCLRCTGPSEGTPFLDDYISTSEVVVDYLTKFSGIQPGDLDANFSSKHVTGLKSVYLKLRFLIDSGVKFVGHGLNNDFRVINLVVPPDQVVDTVNLFYLPNQRMVSLRFLAWHFLGMMIQSDTHDSAEDARAALALFRKYEELKASGELEQALEDLYEVGKKLQWKVPGNEK